MEGRDGNCVVFAEVVSKYNNLLLVRKSARDNTCMGCSLAPRSREVPFRDGKGYETQGYGGTAGRETWGVGHDPGK